MKQNQQLDAWKFLISQLFSLFGSAIVDYVLIWYIAMRSESGMMLSTSLIVNFVPKIMVTQYLGKVIYKCNLKNLIIFSDLFSAMFALILSGAIFFQKDSYLLILLILFFRAACAGIQGPCEKAFISKISTQDELLRVNAVNSTISSAMSLIAPALGGVLVTTISLSASLIVDIITAIIAIFMLFSIKYTAKHGQEEKVTGSKKPIKNKAINWQTLFNFFIIPVAYFTPLLVSITYKDDVGKMSCNEVFYSIGSVCAGIGVSVYTKIVKKEMKYVLPVWITSFALITMTWICDNFFVYLLVLAFTSLNIGIFQILTITHIQLAEKNREGHGVIFCIGSTPAQTC